MTITICRIFSFSLIFLTLLAGCKKSKTTPKGKVSFVLSSKISLKNEGITVNNQSEGVSKFEWYNNDVFLSDNIEPIIIDSVAGKHFVKLKAQDLSGNIFNCIDSFDIFNGFLVDSIKINFIHQNIINDTGSSAGWGLGIKTNGADYPGPQFNLHNPGNCEYRLIDFKDWKSLSKFFSGFQGVDNMPIIKINSYLNVFKYRLSKQPGSNSFANPYISNEKFTSYKIDYLKKEIVFKSNNIEFILKVQWKVV